jgi:hypothetical protein
MDLLNRLGLDIPKGANCHGLVRTFLLESGHAQAVEAGRLLKDLHADRIKADYRLDNPDAATHAAALLAVETAADTMGLIGACSKEPDRTQIKTGIENYKRKLESGPSKGPPG